MLSYPFRLLVIVSQAINVAAFNGWPDETVSARAYRQRSSPAWRCLQVTLDTIYFWQDQHCKQCYDWEMAGLDHPPEYRPKQQ